MCGIVGVAYRNPRVRGPIPNAVIARLAHRGPDGHGVFSNEHVQFAHTRLAIIDLSDAGRQPMTTADGRLTVIFNGEIYNYVELKAELEQHGHVFHSHSDTEVLLASYREWGADCVARFRGMFAFAIWDEREKSLFLARDRCGEKPLLFIKTEQSIAFASEMKALLPLTGLRPEIDPAVVDYYLHYQYVPEPHTLLRGVRKLPAAHTLLIRLDNWSAEPKRYWCVEDAEPADTRDQLLDKIRASLEDAVRLTLRSDVPVGVALSGGIDSSAIAALARKHTSGKLHAFSVGYPGRPHYDERAQAQVLAGSLGIEVHEVELPVASFVDFFPQLVGIMDEPIGDPAAFGHYSVPKAAADQGVKVLLSGIGGDEVFWGYPWVTQTARTNQLLSRAPALRKARPVLNAPVISRLLDKAVRHPLTPEGIRSVCRSLDDMRSVSDLTDQLHFYMGSGDFRDAFRFKSAVYGGAMASLAKDNPFGPTAIGPRVYDDIPAAVVRLLFDTWLVSNCLTLGDRVSMSVGVETRLPFLDVDLIDAVMGMRRLSPDHRDGQKAWLRRALRGILPEDVRTRPKAGFQPPVQQWLRGVTDAYGGALENGRLCDAGILRADAPQAVGLLREQGWPGLFFVYKLVLLEMWCQRVAYV